MTQSAELTNPQLNLFISFSLLKRNARKIVRFMYHKIQVILLQGILHFSIANKKPDLHFWYSLLVFFQVMVIDVKT